MSGLGLCHAQKNMKDAFASLKAIDECSLRKGLLVESSSVFDARKSGDGEQEMRSAQLAGLRC